MFPILFKRVITRSFLSVVAVFALSISASHGLITLDDTPESDYVTLSLSPYVSPVGFLSTTYNGTTTEYSTATLVSENWVLAAAHTVVRSGLELSNLSLSLNGNTYYGDLSEIHIFPTYDPDLSLVGNYGKDLALFRLTSAATGVSTAKIGNALPAEGTSATIAGYGRRGNGLTGDIYPAGTLLAGRNDIDLIDTGLGVFFTDFDSPAGTNNIIGSPYPILLEAGAAPGDSGAPTFIQYENGEWGVVGILSGIGNLDSDPTMKYGDFTIQTSLSDHITWMESTGADIAVVPEVPVQSLLLFSAAAFGALALAKRVRSGAWRAARPISIASGHPKNSPF